jgi:hypothetical protein
MVVGGSAEDANESDNAQEIVIPTMLQESEPSIVNLLQEMERTVADEELIQGKIKDAKWLPIFRSTSPSDFAKIVKHVNMDFRQASVATMVAEKVDKFMCAHVVAALKTVSDWNRASLVEKLLPLCQDLKENHQNIVDQLSNWDQTVTASAFRTALGQDPY